MKKAHARLATLLPLIAGIGLVIAGVVLFEYFDRKMEKMDDDVKQYEQLTNDSASYRNWISGNLTKPRSIQIHVFNVTNAEAATNGSEPKVQEIGPFVYRVNPTLQPDFSRDGKLLTYMLKLDFVFDEKASGKLREKDPVTVVNFPILSLIAKLRHQTDKDMVKNITDMLSEAKNEPVFKIISVGELIWGYNDSFLGKIRKYNLFNDTTIGLLHQSGSPRKQRSMGEWVISTGVDDPDCLWNIKEWDKKQTLQYWNSEASNAINGSDGYGWHADVEPGEILQTFDPDWCRSFDLVSEGQSSKGDLTLERYTFAPYVLNLSVSGNEGFWEPTPDGAKHLEPGAINVSSCNPERIPWILSQSHFYEADPSYASKVKGLRPANKDQDENRVDVDKLTGEVVWARYFIQFNFLVRNDSDIFNATRHMHSVVVPTAYVTETYELSDAERERIEKLYSDRSQKKQMYDKIQYSLIGVGIFLLVVALIVFIATKIKLRAAEGDDETRPLLQGQ